MEITIEETIEAPLDTVWLAWVSPTHITQWNYASEDWCCPNAEIELKKGGRFKYRMERKDAAMGFDFEGEFTKIKKQELIQYKMADDRQVRIQFTQINQVVKIKETFEAEDEHTAEQQRQGWQNILKNFKSHTEQLKDNNS